MTNDLKAKSGSTVTWPLYLLFFTSVDTVLFGTNSNKTFLFVPRIVAFFLIVLLPFLKTESNNRKMTGGGILAFICMVFLLLMSSFVNQDPLETTLSRTLTLISSIVIVGCYSDREYFTALDRFLFLISVFALVTEFFAYFFPQVISDLPVITNTVKHKIYVYFFGAIEKSNLSRDLIRANGIFWEPGSYSIYLIIGIIYQLFGRSKINVLHLLVYVIALIFTFSTTGYIAFAVVLLGFTFSKRNDALSKRVRGVLISSTVLFFLISILLDSTTIQEFVFSKLFSGTSSATTRYSSLFNGMKVAISHPILGVGNSYRQYMAEYVVDSVFNNGGTSITNTIVAQFACYGFPFGIFFLIGTLVFFKRWSQNNFDWIVLCVCIVLAYSGERFFSFLPFVFTFYGFCDTNPNQKALPNRKTDETLPLQSKA